MNQKQIEEIRARCKLAIEASPYVGLAAVFRDAINDVPDLLDALEEAQSYAAGVQAGVDYQEMGEPGK